MSWYLISPSRLKLSGSYSHVESFRGVALVIVSCDHVIDCFHEVVNLLSASSYSLVLKHTVSTTTLRHRGSRLDLLINGLTSKNISMSKNHHCVVWSITAQQFCKIIKQGRVCTRHPAKLHHNYKGVWSWPGLGYRFCNDLLVLLTL